MTIIEELQNFLYTPYGLGVLSAASIIITSLIWLLGCCVFFCCRHRMKRRENGVTEANTDLKYMSVLQPQQVKNDAYSGTCSSGYQSNVGTLNYSLHSLGHDELIAHSSMDSILDK